MSKTLADVMRKTQQQDNGKEMRGGSISEFQYSLIDRMSSLYNQDFTEMINKLLGYSSKLSTLVNNDEKNKIKRFISDINKIHDEVNSKMVERQDEREKKREKEEAEEERL